MKGFTNLVIGAVLAVTAVVPTMAQDKKVSVCPSRDLATDASGRRAAEEPVFLGLANDGAIVALHAFDDGTWTLLVTLPSGVSCQMAGGDYWKQQGNRVPAATI